MAKEQAEATDVPGIREVSFNLNDALRNGLSPDDYMPRNSAVAYATQNLLSTGHGAITPDEIVQPSGIQNGVPMTDWSATGVPVIVMGERSRWLLGNTTVSSADSAWALTQQGASFTAGGPWHWAFFLEIPVFTNGTVFLWGTGASRTTDITVNAVGKDNRKLLLGGMAGAVFSGAYFSRILQVWKDVNPVSISYSSQAWDTGWIMYGEWKGGSSDRPLDEMLAMLGLYTSDNQNDMEEKAKTGLRNGTWGMCPLVYPGTVMAFHEMANGPLVFGQNGVCRLVPNEGTYIDRRVHPIGIAGRGCVGGHLGECLFIDQHRELWKSNGDNVSRVKTGYANQLSGLTLAQTTISFDPQDGNYYIADKSLCYMLNANDGLSGPFDVFANNVVRDNGSLYGLVNDREEIFPATAFGSSLGWTLGAGWSVSGAQLSGTTTTATASRAIAVPTGVAYRVKYAVTVTSGAVRVKLGTANGTSRAAMGVYEEVITMTGSSTLSFEGVVSFTGAITQVSIVPAYLDVSFTSWPIDNNERGTKHLTAMQIASENITSRKGGADYRYDDAEASYGTGPRTDATEAGAVFPYPRVQYADARFVVTGKVLRGTRGRLERVEIRYQSDDITFRRGI